jgi:hypothetical protein
LVFLSATQRMRALSRAAARPLPSSTTLEVLRLRGGSVRSMLCAAGPLGCVRAFTAVHLAVAIRVAAAFTLLAVIVPLLVLSMSGMTRMASMAVPCGLALMLAMALMRSMLLMDLLRLCRLSSSGRGEAERCRSG